MVGSSAAHEPLRGGRKAPFGRASPRRARRRTQLRPRRGAHRRLTPPRTPTSTARARAPSRARPVALAARGHAPRASGCSPRASWRARPSASDPSSAGRSRRRASAADPFDPNERKRLYQEQLAAHDAEPVDAQWARQVEAKLGDHLARTSRQRWKATGVSCRTTTCTATLEWTSYRDAVLSYNHVLSGRSESDPNCARMVMLPEPADANAAYSARAIFDCTETR